MIRIFSIAVFFLLFPITIFMGGVQGNENDRSFFVPGFEDIPLMQDLEGGKFETSFFDSPYGRVVESTVIVNALAKDIKKFYDLTLPQLGWVEFKKNYFLREQEILNLQVEKIEKSDLVLVKFFLSPKGQ
jgi:hypothetical protein